MAKRIPNKSGFGEHWTEDEVKQLDALRTPELVQTFLDELEYHGEITCRSPRRVLRDRKAHCFEGAMLALAAFQHHGEVAHLVDLGAVRDDDHVIVIFRRRNLLGAVAKSNFSGIRYRAPVYRNLRELAMSYFDDYFNADGERTLRSFSRPLNLTDRVYRGWRFAEEDLDPVGDRLTALHHFAMFPPVVESQIPKVDARRLQSGLLGSNAAGLYKVK